MSVPGIQMHIGQRPVFVCGNEGGEGDITCSNTAKAAELLLESWDKIKTRFHF